MKSGLAAAMLMAGVPALAQSPATAPPAGGTSTVQALFEQASTAANAGNYRGAVDLYTVLEGRTKSARSLAIIRLRKGLALIELGERDQAAALLDQALPVLPTTDATLIEDRAAGLRGLARIAFTDFDYEKAQRLYAQASAMSTDPAGRIVALTGEAQATTFIDPGVALEKAGEAGRLAATNKELLRQTVSQVASARGRALLNLGRFAEAEKAFAAGVKAEGGLSLKVDYDDLVARSDASIAAMLAGHRDEARNYLVYTGAGRMEKQDFTIGADMALPICGEEDIRPDDVAVVEFGIGDDGAVNYARPIYGSRQGGMALVFAQAVSQWSWRPEDVANISPLMRFVTRLELRCSTSEGGPSLLNSLRQAFDDWLEKEGLPPFITASQSGQSQRQADALAAIQHIRAAQGDGAPALIPPLASLLASPLASEEERAEYRPLLRSLVQRTNAPSLPRLFLDVLTADESRRKSGSLSAVSETPYLGDPSALAMLRLLRYDDLSPRQKPRNRILLDRIIADPGLAPDHPMRIAALTRRASSLAAEKDLEGARRDFLATGLTAQQCSVVDAKPSRTSAPTSSADYPTDMVRVGVEGWARIQFDIGADGRTSNQRAVITYPPMIFSANGQKIVGRARFEQSYRPDSGLGCGGSMTNVIFRNAYR
jgi:tetratricopeptide (TPR) repeat protein